MFPECIIIHVCYNTPMNTISYSTSRCVIINMFPGCIIIHVCYNTPMNSISYSSSRCVIREYSSALYLGMAPKKNGRPYISIASGELKSLVIYIDKF